MITAQIFLIGGLTACRLTYVLQWEKNQLTFKYDASFILFSPSTKQLCPLDCSNFSQNKDPRKITQNPVAPKTLSRFPVSSSVLVPVDVESCTFHVSLQLFFPT